MRFAIQTDSLHEYEIMLLVTYIGTLESIRRRVILIEEAQNYLLSPYSADTLKKRGVNPEISHLIYCACELEDIESLIPDELDHAIQELIEQSLASLAKIPKPTLPTEKWLAKGETSPT